MLTIPHTDLTVSEICLGTDIAGTSHGEEAFFALLDAFVAGGGNFIDTANVYARWMPHGENCSEQMIGRWLKSRKKPLVVATKGGHPDIRTGKRRVTREDIAVDIDSSRSALHLDTIDLYYLHRDDPSLPMGEILEMMNEFVKEGVIRYFAASNFGPDRMREAEAYAASHGLQGFTALSNRRGPATPNKAPNPDPASDMWYCDEEGWRYHEETKLPMLPYQATSRGYFAKKAAGVDVSHLEGLFGNRENEARLKRLTEESAQTGYSVHALSIVDLVRSASFPLIPVVGVSRPSHISDLLTAMSLLSQG